ncbi:hypothetical protein BBP40_005209, partial [Aspergillus hancockii]
DGPSHLSSLTCQPANGDCSVSLASLYSVSISVNAGINLGLNSEKASAGLSLGISWPVGRATTDSASVTCPPGEYTCSLAIKPSVYEVKGHVAWTHPSYKPCSHYEDGDYTIQYPMLDAQKKPLANVYACACLDRKGWADKGAPRVCPLNCNGS